MPRGGAPRYCSRSDRGERVGEKLNKVWLSRGIHRAKKKVQLGKGVDGGARGGQERKDHFGEDIVMGDQETISGEIKTSVPFVIRRVTEEDTMGGARGELMRNGERREYGCRMKRCQKEQNGVSRCESQL